MDALKIEKLENEMDALKKKMKHGKTGEKKHHSAKKDSHHSHRKERHHDDDEDDYNYVSSYEDSNVGEAVPMSSYLILL